MQQETDLLHVNPDNSYQFYTITQNQSGGDQIGWHFVLHQLPDNTYQTSAFPWYADPGLTAASGPNGKDLQLVPNGSGGLLVASQTTDTNGQQTNVWLRNIVQPGSSGAGADLSLPIQSIHNLVIGENTTAFAAGGLVSSPNGRLVSFDMNAGTPNWTYDSTFGGNSGTWVDTVAAGPDNSLRATEGFYKEARVAFTLDANGLRTDDPVSGDQITFLTSAGVGSRTWMGADQTTLASLGTFENIFGMPTFMQSGFSIGTPGVTAFVQTVIAKILSMYPQRSPQGQEGEPFPQIKSCKDDGVHPPCPREAIYNAFKDLTNKLAANQACAKAAQTAVFDKLKKDVNGFPLTTESFLRYVQRKMPQVFDGTKSTWAYKNALCGAGLSWCRLNTGDITVAEFFAANKPTAVTETPSFPLLVFVSPNDIILDADGANVTNEALVFHEALHGMTGKDDDGLMSVLRGLKDVGLPSIFISYYIADNVLISCY